MDFVRIVVHGNGLLNLWADIAPGKPRHSEAARAGLSDRLASYSDVCATPLTIVFEGIDAGAETAFLYAHNQVETLFTTDPQHTKQLLQRLATRSKTTGPLLMVTDDESCRESVTALGSQGCSCAQFRQTVDAALGELQHDLQNYNQSEELKFKSHL